LSPMPIRARPLAALAAVSAAAATPPAAPLGPVVELPVFEVSDSRVLPPPEEWRYAEIPGFEILSRLSERETRRFVADFLLLQQVIEIIMPGLTRGQVAVPTALILCGRGRGFDEFLPVRDRAERFAMNSLFFQNPERAAIVVDFALQELRFGDAETVESDPYRSFYIEYFRHLIRRQLAAPPPAWFEEGLVQLFGAIDFSRETITFGQIGDGFGAEKLGDFNQVLSRKALVPLGEMLRTEGPRQRTRYWKAQCYAFVHLCLYGNNRKYQKPFLQFVTRLGSEPLSEQLFKECFNRTYRQMALEIRSHCEFTVYNAMRFQAKKGEALPAPPPVELRSAPDADVGRIKGEVLRLGGHGDSARNALIAPYVRGERDPRLLAALGLDELESGRRDRARRFLEAAAQAGAVRARAHVELARLRLEEARQRPGAPEGRLSEAQVTAVLTPLFTALKQPPPLAATYGLIAETWMQSVVAPQAEHLAVVIEGLNRFPRDLALLQQAALLAHRRGFPTEAKAMAERGVKLARDPGDRERFQLLRSSLDAPTPATVPAAPAASPVPQDSFLDGLTTLARPPAAPPAPASPPAPAK
ncbi:MAG: hypothetical protein ACO3JJ_05550, partial [Opitutaceae bacterium]